MSHRYVVENVLQISPSTILLNLRIAEGERLFSFQPGQYAAISFYRHGRPTAARCFSIVSSPTSQEVLQFSMRSRGHFTKALSTMKPGDKVVVRGPYGGFVLDTAHDKDIVMLAGGIGITPFMSMIRYATRTDTRNRMCLVYSCQSQDDIPFYEELLMLQKANPNFSVVYVIGSGGTEKLQGHQVFTGFVTPEVVQATGSDTIPNTLYYICGPPPFMKAVDKTLHAHGASKHQIMTEVFAQGPNKQTGKIKNWPRSMYVLGALGLGVGTFVVMVSDFVKTLPPSSVLGSNNSNLTKSKLTNSRQTDIDSLVNELTSIANTNPDSDAVTTALAAANTQTSTPTTTQTTTKKTSTSSTTTSGTTQTSTTTSPTSTTTTSTSTTTTATPAPTPTPTKTCTTTQSGTTCI